MKLLLAKLNHLGDTLLMTPTIRFLRERYPDAQIDVLVRSGCEVMLQSNPDIDFLTGIARPEKQHRTWDKELKEFGTAFSRFFLRRYDYAFDFSESDRAKLWLLLSASKRRCVNDGYDTLGNKRWMVNRTSRFQWAREHQVLKDFNTVTDCMGLEGSPGPLRFHPQTTAAQLESKLPFLTKAGPLAVIHPTSRWVFKQWLPERWAAVADHLHRERGMTVVFTCGPDEQEQETVRRSLEAARESHHSTEGRIHLDEFGRMLGLAKLFIGVDTVAMHLAAAMQTPIVALFGPSSEWSWQPWQVPHELVLGPCECKQTRKFVCDKSRPYPCMQSIQPEQVLAAVDRLMQKH